MMKLTPRCASSGASPASRLLASGASACCGMPQFERGDLVYWPGHVGIWIDADRFIHANATDMMVAIAPLRDVATSIEDATGDTIRSVRRPVLP